MNIDINEFKDLVVGNNPRIKAFMFYNSFQLEITKNICVDTIKNIYSFTISAAKFISNSDTRMNIENCAEYLKIALSHAQEFNPKDYCSNHEYIEFVNEMANLLGYDYYIIFMLQIYNCLKKISFTYQSDNDLVSAIFNRTKEKCSKLFICSPTMGEITEMINDPDGDLCNKYEVTVDLDARNNILTGYRIDSIPYFVKSSSRKNGRTFFSKINNTRWVYNRDTYVKMKGKMK